MVAIPSPRNYQFRKSNNFSSRKYGYDFIRINRSITKLYRLFLEDGDVEVRWGATHQPILSLAPQKMAYPIIAAGIRTGVLEIIII